MMTMMLCRVRRRSASHVQVPLEKGLPPDPDLLFRGRAWRRRHQHLPLQLPGGGECICRDKIVCAFTRHSSHAMYSCYSALSLYGTPRKVKGVRIHAARSHAMCTCLYIACCRKLYKLHDGLRTHAARAIRNVLTPHCCFLCGVPQNVCAFTRYIPYAVYSCFTAPRMKPDKRFAHSRGIYHIYQVRTKHARAKQVIKFPCYVSCRCDRNAAWVASCVRRHFVHPSSTFRTVVHPRYHAAPSVSALKLVGVWFAR